MAEVPRWKQIYDDWRAQQEKPRPLANGFTEEMRQQALAPKQVSLTPEQKLKSLEPRRPHGPVGSLLADVCQWCLKPFTITMKHSGKPRNSTDYEPLRKVLKITDHAFEPVICDACMKSVLESALPDDRLKPGVSNCQPPNMLLR
ncbi:MAG TPA: hypothetical protein VFA65_24260 [Bryobacteraceae bacterium]|nr:hypothetical protein [Bryobacteraceae bacterium]